MRHDIDERIKDLVLDDRAAGVDYADMGMTLAEKILYDSEQADDWAWFFGEDELAENEGFMPTREQIEEVKEYLMKYYNYIPQDEEDEEII